jgi:hypothetical protein
MNPGTDDIILKIFSQKMAKILAFLLTILPFKKMIITLVFEKTAHFVPPKIFENCRRL